MKKALRRETVDDLLRSGSVRTKKISEALTKINPYIEVLYTDVGKMLLEESIERADKLFSKFMTKGLTEEEQVELRVLGNQLSSWAKRIEGYNKGVDEINAMHKMKNMG